MFRITPTVRTLLIANVLVFFVATQFPVLKVLGSLYPLGSVYFKPWQFMTYMFLHADFMHLFSNMLGLVFIGAALEDVWGPKRFLTFWLICGIGAGVLYEGIRFYELHQMNESRMAFQENPSGPAFTTYYRQHLPEYESQAVSLGRTLQQDPQNASNIAIAKQAVDAAYDAVLNSPNSGMLGASGALFGVLFAFGFLFPQQTLFIFPIPVPIKAWLFVFLYTAYELYAGLHRTPGDNVAHFAHLGGMLIAFVVLKIWQRNGSYDG